MNGDGIFADPGANGDVVLSITRGSTKLELAIPNGEVGLVAGMLLKVAQQSHALALEKNQTVPPPRSGQAIHLFPLKMSLSDSENDAFQRILFEFGLAGIAFDMPKEVWKSMLTMSASGRGQ